MELRSKYDFARLMHRLLDPLGPLYSDAGARLNLGRTPAHYDPLAAEAEAFSRPLWGLAPFWTSSGGDGGFADIYRRGLAAGTDPDSPEYWGGFVEKDQRFVEMAAIALGLILSPEVLWDPLSGREKRNLASWLYNINLYPLPECNWLFFRVLTNVALLKREAPYDAAAMERALDRLDDFYLGDGWYCDGVSGQIDYYLPFAMHYYGLVYAAVMEKEDPARAARYKERAALFARDFILWFSPSGAALPYGRSLTYRFAQASFWSACLFAGIEPFPVPVMKGIIVRHLNYWMDQSIFDRDGVLTIGYAYPSQIMSETYNAQGSPYWAMKTFLCLALPDGHPFWEADAVPLPGLPSRTLLPRGHMLIDRRGGDVTAYVPGLYDKPGHGRAAEKYAKFAYSTTFGFSASRSNSYLHEAAPDSMLAFVLDGDDTVFTRKVCSVYEMTRDGVYSEWSPFPGILVKTTITPNSEGHSRRHEIESQIACAAYDCGFALPKYLPGVTFGCAVTGEGPEAEDYTINADPGTNLLYPNTTIPAIRYRIEPGSCVLNTRVKTWL